MFGQRGLHMICMYGASWGSTAIEEGFGAVAGILALWILAFGRGGKPEWLVAAGPLPEGLGELRWILRWRQSSDVNDRRPGSGVALCRTRCMGKRNSRRTSPRRASREPVILPLRRCISSALQTAMSLVSALPRSGPTETGTRQCGNANA